MEMGKTFAGHWGLYQRILFSFQIIGTVGGGGGKGLSNI